jgi:hypothetical protein
MLDNLAPADVLTVARLDRLARSTFDLFGGILCFAGITKVLTGALFQ